MSYALGWHWWMAVHLSYVDQKIRDAETLQNIDYKHFSNSWSAFLLSIEIDKMIKALRNFYD